MNDERNNTGRTNRRTPEPRNKLEKNLDTIKVEWYREGREYSIVPQSIGPTFILRKIPLLANFPIWKCSRYILPLANVFIISVFLFILYRIYTRDLGNIGFFVVTIPTVFFLWPLVKSIQEGR